MKRIIQTALIMACILGMKMGQPAHAAQFNLTFPMNLSKVPAEYNSVFVKAFILCGGPAGSAGAEQTGMGPNPFNKQVGGTAYGRVIVGTSQSIHPINTATGEFHSSISLGLNVAQGYYPNNVGSVAYVFKLQGPEVGDIVPTGTSSIGTDIYGGGNTYAMNPRLEIFNNPARVGEHCDNPDFEY
jgi:hypothetical protein